MCRHNEASVTTFRGSVVSQEKKKGKKVGGTLCDNWKLGTHQCITLKCLIKVVFVALFSLSDRPLEYQYTNSANCVHNTTDPHSVL